MMLKYLLGFIFSCALCLSASASAPYCRIVDCSGPVLLNGKAVDLRQLKARRLTAADELTALNKTITLTIVFGNNSETKVLHPNKTFQLSDILDSSFNTLDDDHRFKELFATVCDYFIKTGESKEAYADRYRKNEIGGRPKGGSSDIIHSQSNRQSLGVIDSAALREIETTTKDTVILLLKKGIYFEKNHFFGRAYQHYQRAYLYLKNSGQPAPVVTEFYQQFLYRMGRFEEGNQVND